MSVRRVGKQAPKLVGLIFAIGAPIAMAVEWVDAPLADCEALVVVECREQGRQREADCQDALMEQAEEAEASHLHITDTREFSVRKPSLAGGRQLVEYVGMTATAYSCAVEAETSALPETSTVEKLKQLNQMRDEALISEDEYQRLRRRVLEAF